MLCQFVQVFVALFIIKDDKLLLVEHTKQQETFYTLVGGKVEPGELCKQAAIREADEEAGIIIQDEHLVFAHAISRKIDAHTSSLVIFFQVTDWSGKPFNHEPSKHTEVAWHSIEQLPLSLRPHHKQALELWKDTVYYSEYVPHVLSKL